MAWFRCAGEVLDDYTEVSEYTAKATLDSTNKELEMAIPATGKYGTSNKLKATFSTIASLIGLTSAKIVKGNTILGISGNSNNMDTSGADAAAAHVLNGKKFCVDGSLITGTMTNRQGSTVDASAVSSDATYTYFTTPAGSYSASSKVRTKNSNLINPALVGKSEKANGLASTAASCSLTLEKGKYLIDLHIAATFANGTHQDSIALNVGSLIGTNGFSSTIVTNQIFAGAHLVKHYYVELTETTTVKASRAAHTANGTSVKDYFAIDAIKLA